MKSGDLVSIKCHCFCYKLYTDYDSESLLQKVSKDDIAIVIEKDDHRVLNIDHMIIFHVVTGKRLSIQTAHIKII